MIRRSVSILFIFSVLAVTPTLAESDKQSRSAALPYYNRANRYLSQGRFEDAEKDLLQAIRLFPDEPDFHTNLGVTYRKLDRYADAEREFKIAIAYNRDDWMNWSNLANAYLKQNMLEKTIATFEETLKHSPPAKEVAAIKQDITDIKKVLASQGQAQTPARQKDSQARGNAPSKAAQSKTAPNNTVVKKEIPSVTSAPLTVPTNTGIGKQAEWGYDDKHAQHDQ